MIHDIALIAPVNDTFLTLEITCTIPKIIFMAYTILLQSIILCVVTKSKGAT